MALYTMPRMAMMPLLVVWFGVGVGATVSVVFLGAVFPIFINTSVGIREIDPIYVRAVRSFGGNEWDIFKKVLLPALSAHDVRNPVRRWPWYIRNGGQ